MARRHRDAELERRWRELLALRESSGLPVSRFCEAHQISQASFYAWRRELAKRDQEISESTSPLFVPVQVMSGSAVEVVMPGGVVVRVPPGADGDMAVRLVAALRAA